MTGSGGASDVVSAGTLTVITIAPITRLAPGLMDFGYSAPDHNEASITELLLRRNRTRIPLMAQWRRLSDIAAISYDCAIPAERR
jgi:hypothetical protein